MFLANNLHQGGMFMHNFGWGGIVIGGLSWLILLAALVALVIVGIRTLTRSQNLRRAEAGQTPTVMQTNTALEILKERYARGEITKEQYESMRQDLNS